MSRSIDLFIDAVVSLPDLAAELADLTTLACVEAPEGGAWLLQGQDALAELRANEFRTPGDGVLARYSYVLTAKVSSPTRASADSPQLALVRNVAACLRDSGAHPALLVFDLQHHLDRIEPGGAPGVGGRDADPGSVTAESRR